MMEAPFPEEAVWLIGTISEKLMARNLLLGTAESCTGGLVATLCTNIPGSSRWFAGSIVSYANHVKTGLLQVDSELLRRHGAVSAEVVEAMARSALDRLDVQVGLAVSGIAGPDGGTPQKPVGTVWFGLAALFPGGKKTLNYAAAGAVDAAVDVFSIQKHFSGSRAEVRMAAALAGLEIVARALG